jgi:hypothetical protein
MFILRKVTGDGHEINENLGDSYNITYKELHPKDFEGAESIYKDFDDLFPGELYACITCFNGSKVIPLWKKQGNYIMTESGKTFANVSFK